ncbi:MAG: pyridoxamine 5'-phosphate oxidase family protein [Desulfobacterales bacterium]|nr:pyridoxamine 5'-phosphate oxidase family protein [Desulfobacterales bacterium]
MLTEMKALAQQKNMCVLATVSGQKPYCSLMAYVTDDNCDEIYMVTHKNSTKYKNLMQNPAVSLLIDTREKFPRSQAKALTVEGVFCQIENTVKRKLVAAKLLQTHPHLDDFMQHPEADIFCVKISSFLLLDGLQQAHFEMI